MESLDVDELQSVEGRKVGATNHNRNSSRYGVPLRIRTDRRTTQTPSDWSKTRWSSDCLHRRQDKALNKLIEDEGGLIVTGGKSNHSSRRKR
jgi:hypothetical protein